MLEDDPRKIKVALLQTFLFYRTEVIDKLTEIGETEVHRCRLADNRNLVWKPKVADKTSRCHFYARNYCTLVEVEACQNRCFLFVLSDGANGSVVGSNRSSHGAYGIFWVQVVSVSRHPDQKSEPVLTIQHYACLREGAMRKKN